MCLKKKYNYLKNGNVILSGGSCRKYHYSLLAGHIPFYNEKHISLNTNLLKGLNREVFNNLIYRFHNQIGYNEKERILNEFPKIKISLREDVTHYYDLLYKSRLIISTSDYTANLQPLTINHPVIWLWDPKYFNLRDSAKKYYDLMHEAGILFYSSDLCAKHVNNIFHNPMDWWMSSKVQNAKNIFAQNFCNVSSNISQEMSIIIEKYLNEK